MAKIQDAFPATAEDEKRDRDEKQKEEKLKKILNAKNEPEFGLKLIPEYLVFKYFSNTQGYVTIAILNTKQERQAFKIKCSDNNIYRAKPSVGFIKPGEKVHIRITYLNPEGIGINKDTPFAERKKHVAVYHVSAEDAKTYKEAFAKKTDGVYHYWCHHVCENIADPLDPPSQNGN